MDTSVATEPRTRRRSGLKRACGVFVAAGLAAAVMTAGAWSGAKASPQARTRPAAVVPAADEAPGYAVEDFAYPGADRILAEQGITLERGDGHIVLADCTSEGELLEVRSTESAGTFCFRVTGNSGWLTLKISSVYAVKGNDYTTQVDMTTADEKHTYDIDKNLWTGVGEADDDQGREFQLMEIRTSK
jgi:hypothetical protein